MSRERHTDPTDLADAVRDYRERGYVVLPDLLTPDEVRRVGAALARYLDIGPSGRNDFEGQRTQRVYSLVGRGSVFEAMVEHPVILRLCDRLLERGYLLTASQAICIWPGETPQAIHFDDAFYTIPRPRPAVSVSTIWAIDEFTRDNGATEVIPGSHTWTDAEVAGCYIVDPDASASRHLRDQLVPVEMTPGSCVLFAGTLLHRGAANTTDSRRLGVSHQYCQPWARQQENYCLSVPHERAARMSARLRALLGYSIHPPFMGQIAGRHPQKVLDEGYCNSLLTDDACATLQPTDDHTRNRP